MKYIVLTAKSTFDLEMVVNQHIKAGWFPQGGVSFERGANINFYRQAMIKHRSKPRLSGVIVTETSIG